MKSHAFQDLTPERIKELAAEFSDSEVKASLDESDDNRPFIFEPANGKAAVMYWNSHNGLMAVADDDSVGAHARLDYLRRHGYPCFKSFAEIESYAKQHSWPCAGHNSSKTTD